MEHDDYVKLRSLVVEMVLATDMSNHFAHLKHLKKVISSSDKLAIASIHLYYCTTKFVVCHFKV